MIRKPARLFIAPDKNVFCLCGAGGSVIFDSQDSRCVIMDVMDGRVFRRCRERWQAVDEVWGPGSWGRTVLSPKSLGAPRRAGPGPQGLGRTNFQGPSATRRSML